MNVCRFIAAGMRHSYLEGKAHCAQPTAGEGIDACERAWRGADHGRVSADGGDGQVAGRHSMGLIAE